MTAIQELIRELEQTSNISTNTFIIATLDLAIDMAKDKLEQEKEQIITAFRAGDSENTNWYTAGEYYIDTYGTNL